MTRETLDTDELVELAERPPRAGADTVDFKARRLVLRVIALLLAVQAVTLAVITWVYGARLDWEQELADVMLSARAVDTLFLGGLLLPMALFGMAAAWDMWRGRRGAWLRAMIAQGILLIFCLSSYVANRGENFVYVLMLLCIVLVLYLNTNDVRLSFYGHAAKRRTHSR
jgi:hypothetical protein